MKKVLALALAAMMVLALCGTAFAAVTTTGDTEVTVTGLNAGDKVNLYQVLKWTEGAGWTLTDDFAGLDRTVYTDIDAIIKNTGNTISKTTVEAIVAIAKTKNVTHAPTVAAGNTSVTQEVALGMYLALVEPATPGIVYNPMIVSADLTMGGTNTISSSEKLGTVAKKQPVTIEKTEPKITNDIGDTYNFTIKTKIPSYADSFTNTYFKVSDTMSAYLDYVDQSIKLNGGALPTGCDFAKTDAQNFTVTFNDTYVKANGGQEIVITYSAKLNLTAAEAAALPNVKEEYNKVTVEFPNNPKDDTDRSALKDETREYTFTIDGKLFGNSSWQGKEVVKVGLDKDGKPIESEYNYGHGSKHAALDGAEFILCTEKDTTKLYENQHFDGHVTTANHGLMNISGLDAGTYYLKEISAPNGYIMDQDWHEVKIDAKFKDVEKTEYYTISSGTVTWHDTQVAGSKPCTYTVRVLDSYSVTVDGHETSYTMTLSGPNITKVNPSESDAEIVNTKGLQLPSTGGIGTTIFYVAGLIMVLGASIILVSRRRADAE